jgi:hypothetical protein
MIEGFEETFGCRSVAMISAISAIVIRIMAA